MLEKLWCLLSFVGFYGFYRCCYGVPVEAVCRMAQEIFNETFVTPTQIRPAICRRFEPCWRSEK
jgi:hypothetical protein